MFLYPDGTLVIQLVNFAIFFAILNVVFLRPVGAAIRRRREYINSLVTDYDEYQMEARRLREEAESVRATARRVAEHHVAAARANASNEAAELSAKYAQDGQRIAEEAAHAAAREFDAARKSSDDLSRQLAEMMLERVMAESAA